MEDEERSAVSQDGNRLEIVVPMARRRIVGGDNGDDESQ